MSKKTIYLKAVVDTGATQFATKYLRNFDLTQITEIIITPVEHDGIMVTFFFNTSGNMYMQIDVLGAFCVGYRGEGPWGLHDLMTDAGFSEYTASRVFEISRYAETILIKESW